MRVTAWVWVTALGAGVFAACGSSSDNVTPGRSDAAADASSDGDSEPDADAADSGTSDGSDASDATPSCPAPALPEVETYMLTHGAYPGSGHPDVAVHVPAGFDACRRPSLVAFFHGFDNCVSNAIGSVDTACTPGGPVRIALHLAEQIDAAHVNAMLVAVELAFDQSTGDPGQLQNPGEFRAMLDELFEQHLSPELGVPLAVASLDRVVLASHSGGYWAVASVLDVGGVDVDEVELFDSLYGEYPTYANFIESDIGRFDPASPAPLRFSDVYTTSGGTLTLSETLESEVDTALGQAGLGASLFFDGDTAPTPTAADFAHPVFFKHSGLSHYEVPQYYFEKLIAASTIASLP
jgi:hypothetical protein